MAPTGTLPSRAVEQEQCPDEQRRCGGRDGQQWRSVRVHASTATWLSGR